MAKNDDKRESSGTLKDTLNRFRSIGRLTTSKLYGVEESFYDENDRDLADIRNVITDVTRKYKQSSGENIVEFFNALSFRDNQNVSQSVNQATKDLLDIGNMMNNPEQYNITEIFSQEQGRAQLYSSYRMIYDGIPQMSQALSTYVDNILSPDDFTKRIFNIYMRDLPLTTGESNKENSIDTENIISKCRHIIDTYGLEKNIAKEIITESLKLGDCFVSIIDLKKETGKMVLSEDGVMDMTSIYNDRKLTDKDISLTSEEVMFFTNLTKPKDLISKTQFVNENKSKYTSINQKTKMNEDYEALAESYNQQLKLFNESENELKNEIADIINKNIIFSEDSIVLAEENIKANNEFVTNKKKSKLPLFNNFGTKSNDKNSNKLEVPDEEDNGLHINGSVVKILEPERTVKLELDGLCYGYYYVENTDNGMMDTLTSGQYSMISNTFSNINPNNTQQPDVVNNKYKLITDVFVRNIAKKINKEFINKNKGFKEIIFNILKQNSILDRPIRITYLNPNDVVHFGMKSGSNNDCYHESLYKPIHFSAKIYLAVLTSQVMLRLVRSPEKRKLCDLY